MVTSRGAKSQKFSPANLLARIAILLRGMMPERDVTGPARNPSSTELSGELSAKMVQLPLRRSRTLTPAAVVGVRLPSEDQTTGSRRWRRRALRGESLRCLRVGRAGITRHRGLRSLINRPRQCLTWLLRSSGRSPCCRHPSRYRPRVAGSPAEHGRSPRTLAHATTVSCVPARASCRDGG